MPILHKRFASLLYDPRIEAVAHRAERTPSSWVTLAGLSLAMLLSSLGTSIAKVALPTLAQVFGVPFQAVQ